MIDVQEIINWLQNSNETAEDVARKVGLTNAKERRRLIIECGGTTKQRQAGILIGIMIGIKASELHSKNHESD